VTIHQQEPIGRLDHLQLVDIAKTVQDCGRGGPLVGWVGTPVGRVGQQITALDDAVVDDAVAA
jgi:hypothetical protein